MFNLEKYMRDRALQVCHPVNLQTHQPIEMNCTKKQPSYARLIGNDRAEWSLFSL